MRKIYDVRFLWFVLILCMSFIDKKKKYFILSIGLNVLYPKFFNVKVFCYKVDREFICDDYCSHSRMCKGHGGNTFEPHRKAGYFGAS